MTTTTPMAPTAPAVTTTRASHPFGPLLASEWTKIRSVRSTILALLLLVVLTLGFTTLITGLIAAETGVVSLDGRDITDLPMYRRARLGIGYLPQEASIFRGLTVEQNIRAILEIAEPAADLREAMLDALLAEFSITHLRRAPAMALSGGERRRCEIARALATQPHFILLDEPLAVIDPIAVADIRELVAHLKDRGIGVLITDHNVRETLEIVDRAYILHEGRVLMEGAPAEIVADSDVRRVYLGDRFSL